MGKEYRRQIDVASQLGISPVVLNRYVRGKSRPRVPEAERLAGVAPGTTVMMWLRPDYRALRKVLNLKPWREHKKLQTDKSSDVQ